MQIAGDIAWLRHNAWRIALLFVAILLPLWGFGELGDEVGEGGTFVFDRPILEWLHAHHAPVLDGLAILFSRLGYQYGVIPIDIALVAWLACQRRHQATLFAAIATSGSGLLNVIAKHYYGRPRPSLWESLAPETTFSFPSGHAMGSMTLAAVVVLLAWNTRWRPVAAVVATAFVLLVGASRLYLGVHYPSDILGGWTAALAWTLGLYALMYGIHLAQRRGR